MQLALGACNDPRIAPNPMCGSSKVGVAGNARRILVTSNGGVMTIEPELRHCAVDSSRRAHLIVRRCQ